MRLEGREGKKPGFPKRMFCAWTQRASSWGVGSEGGSSCTPPSLAPTPLLRYIILKSAYFMRLGGRLDGIFCRTLSDSQPGGEITSAEVENADRLLINFRYSSILQSSHSARISSLQLYSSPSFNCERICVHSAIKFLLMQELIPILSCYILHITLWRQCHSKFRAVEIRHKGSDKSDGHSQVKNSGKEPHAFVMHPLQDHMLPRESLFRETNDRCGKTRQGRNLWQKK